jgi:hypothetical protein
LATKDRKIYMQEELTRDTADSTCSCLQGVFYYQNFQETYLGGDRADGEVDALTCKQCGRLWLSVLYEPKIYDDSGQRYYGLLEEEDRVRLLAELRQGDVSKNAWEKLDSLDWHYCTGTYWADQGLQVPFRSSGKIYLR